MINRADWNEKLGLAKPITEEYVQFNHYIEQLKSTYFACYREMVLQKKEISTESFRKLYYGIVEVHWFDTYKQIFCLALPVAVLNAIKTINAKIYFIGKNSL
jgi:hypothetical protein